MKRRTARLARIGRVSLLLSCGCFAGSLLAQPRLPVVSSQVDDRAAELSNIERHLRTVRVKRDKVKASTLRGLAGSGSREAFEALVAAIGYLRDPDKLGLAFGSFWYFREDEALSRRAVEFLRQKALTAPRKRTREAAVFPLSYFEELALPAYRSLVEESKDAEVRTLAIGHLIEPLSELGDAESLQAILDNAQAADLDTEPCPLDAFAPEVARAALVEKLADRKTDVEWRLVLLRILADEPGDDITLTLKELLRHPEPAVQIAVVKALMVRGEEAMATVELQRMRRYSKPHVRVEVVRILSRIFLDDEDWMQTLGSLARARDESKRIAAVGGYGEIAGEESIRKLIELLDDKNWRVRSAVLESMERLRSHDFLWPLILRLDVEEGRLRWDVSRTLTRMTGVDLGRSKAGWTRWYEAEGSSCPLPSVEQLQEREAQRQALEAAAEATTATFYGLPIYSQRTCFVLDVSGSMDEPAESRNRTQTEENPNTRIDVARDELYAMIERIPPESRCNFVFFNDRIDAWQAELHPMDEKAKADALEFIRDRSARGATNLYDALAAALEDEAIDTIYLLSDGVPNAGEYTGELRIRREISQWNTLARVRIHAISVGQESKLLRNLAEDSGAAYLEVGFEADAE